ncbi:MAG: alpha-hydroxy-acid oxidizing protein [Planctomycetes bacterium]|nr:alpha-hydroxy-acid oxidizing protein [Planctomycetota bacterium]
MAERASQTKSSRGQDGDDDLRRFRTLDELEAMAGTRLSQMAHAYFVGGAGDEHTLGQNTSAWGEIDIWHRVLVDVSQRSTACDLFGRPSSMPILAAPTALHKLAHADGECATARGCEVAGVPMVISSLASTSIEEIAAAARCPLLMQVYLGQDRELGRDLMARAEAAGVVGFELTVDTPVWGLRRREIASGFHIPPGMDVVNLRRTGGGTSSAGVGIAEVLGWTISPSVTWKDLEWACGLTKLPIFAKGICRADDARRAMDAGVRGVVVSNHGGRQLDGTPATARALPGVVRAVEGRVPVLVDGGIRRGVDVLRALALGATAVQIGRPVLWGLACGGSAGVARCFEILREELDRAMALAGCPSVASIQGDLLKQG